jgi:hypothetical protein
MQTRPLQFSLVCGSCSSGRDFASSFLQIPRHRGHPCLRLVVPTAKPTADFHRQAIAHAGHTYKKEHPRCSFLPKIFWHQDGSEESSPSPISKRTNRRITIFSPILPISSVNKSFTVLSWSLINSCSKRHFSP